MITCNLTNCKLKINLNLNFLDKNNNLKTSLKEIKFLQTKIMIRKFKLI